MKEIWNKTDAETGLLISFQNTRKKGTKGDPQNYRKDKYFYFVSYISNAKVYNHIIVRKKHLWEFF